MGPECQWMEVLKYGWTPSHELFSICSILDRLQLPFFYTDSSFDGKIVISVVKHSLSRQRSCILTRSLSLPWCILKSQRATRYMYILPALLGYLLPPHWLLYLICFGIFSWKWKIDKYVLFSHAMAHAHKLALHCSSFHFYSKYYISHSFLSFLFFFSFWLLSYIL